MALYCLFTVFISMLDATVIILHLMLFAALYGIIIRVAEKISKRSFKINWRGHLTFITTIVYLSIAYFLCNNVWRTHYDIKTDKLKENVKIALITDSHLSTTLDGDEFEKYLNDIACEKPDIILISGDFVDDSTQKTDLVLSGHTHGGQLLPITYFGELTGMNDKTYGYERRDNTDFIVSSGISDWAIHFKSGTKSEYVIINLQNTGKIDH